MTQNTFAKNCDFWAKVYSCLLIIKLFYFCKIFLSAQITRGDGGIRPQTVNGIEAEGYRPHIRQQHGQRRQQVHIRYRDDAPQHIQNADIRSVGEEIVRLRTYSAAQDGVDEVRPSESTMNAATIPGKSLYSGR